MEDRVSFCIFLFFVFLLGSYTFSAFASVPPQITYRDRHNPAGIYKSAQAACATQIPANTPSTQWSNPQADLCDNPKNNSCDCLYDMTQTGVTKTFRYQNWVIISRICPSGMSFLSDFTACKGEPDDKEPDCPRVGNPINPFTGVKHQKETDFSITNAGSLMIMREYKSNSKFNSGFGYKWSSALLGKKLSIGDNQLLEIQNSGHVELWSKINGVWAHPTGSRSVLTETPSGYELSRINNIQEYYDLQGRLLKINNENNMELTYAYDPQGDLQSVTNAYGQALQFSFGDSGNVTSITTPDNQVIKYQYSQGNLTKVIYPDDTPLNDKDNPVRIYHYASNATITWGLTGITDEKGNRFATWSYNPSGKATSSEHAGGVEHVTLDYTDIVNSKVAVTNTLGKKTTYHFKTFNHTRKTSHVEGHATTSCAAASQYYTYDTNGFIRTQTDWNGVVTETVRDNQGKILQKRNGLTWSNGVDSTLIDSAQSTKIFTTWHPTLGLPEKKIFHKYSQGNYVAYRQEDYAYDSNKRIDLKTLTDLTQVTAPHITSGRTRTWDYSYTYWDTEKKQLKSTTIDGPRINNTKDLHTTEYSQQGYVTKVTNAMGHVYQITAHDAAGRPKTISDYNGVETQLTYTARGWLKTKTVKDPGGNTALDNIITLNYDAVGQITQIIYADGTQINYEYDHAQRLTAISNALSERIEYTLDTAGNTTKQVIKSGANTLLNTQRQAFDELSRLRKVIGASNQTVSYDYDLNDNLVMANDAKAQPTHSAYDALDRLITQTDPDNFTASYSYNNQGYLKTVTDKRGLVTTYQYDGLDNLIKVNSPDTGTTNYSYDNAGNRISNTDARGVIIVYNYDAINRLSSITYPTNVIENVTYTYDDTLNGNFGIGRLTGISKDKETLHYTYDALGNITQVSASVVGANYLTHYTHTPSGKIKSIQYPSARLLHYQYDTLGRVSGVTTQTNAGAPIKTLISDITYLPFGPVSGFKYSNGITQSYQYDQDYRLTKLSSNVQQWDYTYDLNSNIETINDINASTKNQTFHYDKLNRLIKANGPYGEYNYLYDASGNRTQRQKNIGAGTTLNVEDYNYATTSNQLNTVATTENSTVIDTRDFVYEKNGQLVSDKNTQRTHVFNYNQANRMDQLSTGTQTADYKYNPLGQRIQKIIKDTTGNVVKHIHYHYDLSGQLLAETDEKGNVIREYLYFNGQAVGMLVGGATQNPLYYMHNDHLGTPRILTDQTQAKIWEIQTTPFGEVHEEIGNGVEQIKRFAGQYVDGESGLYYNYYRDYDPSTGRYVQSDPIGLQGGLNTYAYVGGNPLMYTDPYGLAPPGNIPPGVNIQQNMAEASNMSPAEFYNAVRNGGKWDYKQQGSQYEAFGNYNFGLTGRAAGFPGNMLNRGAGWAQGRAGTSNPNWGNWWGGPPYGDDPRDQRWIDEGRNDHDDGYYDSWDDGSSCRQNPPNWSTPNPSGCYWDYSTTPPRARCPGHP